MNLYAGREEPTTDCDACGARFREARSSCPRCGATRVQPASAAKPTAGRRLHETALAVGALGLAVVAAGLLAWPSTRHRATSSPRAMTGGSERAGTTASSQARRADQIVADEEAGAARAFLDTKGAAALAYSEGRVEDALVHYQEVLARHPTDPEALNNVGQVLVRLGRASEALPYLEQAASGFPDRWDFQFNLARALGETGGWGEAAERYRSVAAARPDDDVVAFNLGRALERAGRVPEAITAFQRALELAPLDPSFHLALALAQERAADLAAARTSYEGYLALLPDGDEAQRVRAHLATLAQPAGAGTGGG